MRKCTFKIFFLPTLEFSMFFPPELVTATNFTNNQNKHKLDVIHEVIYEVPVGVSWPPT